MTRTSLPNSRPITTEVVLTTRKGLRCQLGKVVGCGGEGEIFETDNASLVAKIYHQGRSTEARFQKLDLMLRNGPDRSNPDASGICWPLGILLDSHKEPRGYLMKRASGRPLSLTVFIPSQLRVSFPAWDRTHLVKLAITILKKIAVLHRAGVLLGDINGMNILIVSESEVYFVDCDSFQIGDFPCPVGTIHFTPPELQGADLSSTVRTLEHELFAIGTLLFLILMLGKPPYAASGGGTPAENIRAMEFAYAFQTNSRRNAPDGQWRFMWSHLPYRLKQAFFETFDKTCRDRPRRSLDELLWLLRGYSYALDRGFASRELMPSQLKQLSAHAQSHFGAGEEREVRMLHQEGA